MDLIFIIIIRSKIWAKVLDMDMGLKLLMSFIDLDLSFLIGTI